MFVFLETLQNERLYNSGRITKHVTHATRFGTHEEKSLSFIILFFSLLCSRIVYSSPLALPGTRAMIVEKKNTEKREKRSLTWNGRFYIMT